MSWDSVWMDASGEVWGQAHSDRDEFWGLGFVEGTQTAAWIVKTYGGPLVRMQPHPRLPVEVSIDDALRDVAKAQRSLAVAHERARRALDDS